MAAGCPSVNLDSFMMSEQHICDLYRRYTSVADYAVTEGVMGLLTDTMLCREVVLKSRVH